MNWRTASPVVSSEKRYPSQGCLEVKKYQRSASAPNRSITSHGSTVLPIDLDILRPCSSRISPRQTTLRYEERSNSRVEIAISEQNQPRVWSSASQTKSAGKRCSK